MSRSSLFRTSDFAYHVTVRSNNKEWFYLPSSEAWKIFAEKLHLCNEKYGLNLHAFVLMSNHFHMIVSTPNCNLDLAMRYLLTEVSRAIQRATGRINHIFGGRYRWSVLDSGWALAYGMKYCYRNPVRAGICEKVEDYAFSTFKNGDIFPLSEGVDQYWKYVPKNESHRSKWLNLPTPKEQEEIVRKALRRYKFQFSYNGNTLPVLKALHNSYGVGESIETHPLPFGMKSR